MSDGEIAAWQIYVTNNVTRAWDLEEISESR